MDHFELHSEYKPTGDQPQAIERLVRGFKEGNQFETLLGVTGSGKTFTMANVIAQLNKPTLILAHNKTLAAQLYGEMKEFFPENAVEYFVSYYDYYQPEAYVPSSDTYIAKDSSINDEIDKLRLSATAAMSERKDVVVISSVSCIYGLGSPQEFFDMMISLRPGMTKDRDEVIRELIDIQYTRNDRRNQMPAFSYQYLPCIPLCSASRTDPESSCSNRRRIKRTCRVFQKRRQASGSPANLRTHQFRH